MKKYKHTWIKEEWERMGRPQCEFCHPCSTPPYNKWQECAGDPSFAEGYQYRIKCKTWVNWEHVHPSIVAMATNIYGDTEFHTIKPEFLINADCWDGLPLGVANSFSSFTRGTCDWRNSLVMRPVVVGEEK